MLEIVVESEGADGYTGVRAESPAAKRLSIRLRFIAQFRFLLGFRFYHSCSCVSMFSLISVGELYISFYDLLYNLSYEGVNINSDETDAMSSVGRDRLGCLRYRVEWGGTGP